MSARVIARASSVLAAALLVVSCGRDGQGPIDPPPVGGVSVLFVGNSLTYVNDLPRTLQEMAHDAGDTVHVESVTKGNTAVIDHAYGMTDAMEHVAAGGWDYVVLQQGPTSLRLCRDTLVLAARLFDVAVREGGGVTALFMTWPSADRRIYFDAVRDSYRAAARAVDGRFFPVGEAFREASRRDPSLQLYDYDGYHPARLGTLLAALVIYEQVTGRDARGLPLDLKVAGEPVRVPAATIHLLMDVAHSVNERYAPPDGLGSAEEDVIVDSPPPAGIC